MFAVVTCLGVVPSTIDSGDIGVVVITVYVSADAVPIGIPDASASGGRTGAGAVASGYVDGPLSSPSLRWRLVRVMGIKKSLSSQSTSVQMPSPSGRRCRCRMLVVPEQLQSPSMGH